MKLLNKVALITGASRGIGHEVAKLFAQEGALLGLNYLNSKDAAEELAAEINSNGGRAITIKADVGDENQVEAMVNRMIEEFGRIDILVNNAAYNKQCFVKDMSIEVWDSFIKTNLRSVFLSTRLVVPHMIKNNYGRIINVTSNLGQKGGREMSHYSASKGGVISFTKSLALELGDYNITANCVAPGPIETDMLATNTEEWNARKKAELPLHRFGKVEEVAPAFLFLASDPDGSIFTGQTLGPNCGDVML